MQRITIDPDIIGDPDDIEILQDTIVAAINDCMNKIDAETERVMSQFTQGGMPGLF
jgi:DNA-binding protein YbaB